MPCNKQVILKQNSKVMDHIFGEESIISNKSSKSK